MASAIAERFRWFEQNLLLSWLFLILGLLLFIRLVLDIFIFFLPLLLSTSLLVVVLHNCGFSCSYHCITVDDYDRKESFMIESQTKTTGEGNCAMINALKEIIFEDFTYMSSDDPNDVEEEVMPKFVGNHIDEPSGGRSELVGSVIISRSDEKIIRAVMNVDGEEVVVMNGIKDVALPALLYIR